MIEKEVLQLIEGEEAEDGAGVRLKRVIGSSELNFLDPFLLLDEFKNENPDDYIAGFPDHPHRGFETVTYLIAGKMRHRDSRGNEGLLLPGSVQWMRAGKGIIHSEMPEMENGLIWGYQLWVNLPRSHKMSEPGYQDIMPERIPVVKENGCSVKVIAGQYGDIRGPAETVISIIYFDVEMEANSSFRYDYPPSMNSFVFAVSGSFSVGDKKTTVQEGELAVIGEGDSLLVHSAGESRFLLLCADPINESIARGGPFVMNTREEIMQAFRDYQTGQFA